MAGRPGRVSASKFSLARDAGAVRVLISRENQARTTLRARRARPHRREIMSNQHDRGAGIDRRSFIGSSIAAAGLLAGGAMQRAWAQDVRLATQTRAVQTTSGSIQGIVLDGGV